MRLAIRQLHYAEHHVIVIGDVETAKHCSNQGVPVHGSLGGWLNGSRTLSRRLLQYIKESRTWNSEKLMAWGSHAMSISSECALEYDAYAVIDEVDHMTANSSGHTVIPTTELGSRRALQLGIPETCMTEPLVGVEPTSIITDRATVLDALQVRGDTLLISIIGMTGSWQTILGMTGRMKTAKQQAVFVLPHDFRDRALIMNAAKKRGVIEMMRDLPPQLRQVDLLHAVDCAWCPPHAPFDTTTNVLDVLFAAWESVPLAVHNTHPIACIPTIGSQIAWVSSELEVFGWMLSLKKDPTISQQRCAEQVTAVRSITAPSRFIEGLQLRMHAQNLFTA